MHTNQDLRLVCSAVCGGILPPIRTLYNKIPMKITAGYIVLIVVLLIISNAESDLEGRIFDYLVIGFPWVLIVMNDSIWGTALFVILNSLTVYLVALIFVESFEDTDRDGI
jgi:hypothetical protein